MQLPGIQWLQLLKEVEVVVTVHVSIRPTLESGRCHTSNLVFSAIIL